MMPHIAHIRRINMSYSELVKELALDGRVIAVTRVNAADEEIDHIAGCVYKSLKKVMAGQTLVLDRSSCSCNGFVHNAGFSDERPRIPGGFGVFLSHGSDQMWTPPGERFKCDPATAEAMFDGLPKDVIGGFDAIKFEPYRDDLDPDVVVCFATPDQLSAMIVLHGYNRAEYDHVIATTVSGCASMLRIPFSEKKKNKPKAVITATDLAQRHFVDEELLAISITGSDFRKMLDATGECFFHSPVFKKVRQRIRKDENLTDRKFSVLA